MIISVEESAPSQIKGKVRHVSYLHSAKAFNMESHENWTKKLIQFGLNIHALLWFEECSKELGKQLSSKYQTRLKCLVRYHRDLY